MPAEVDMAAFAWALNLAGEKSLLDGQAIGVISTPIGAIVSEKTDGTICAGLD